MPLPLSATSRSTSLAAGAQPHLDASPVGRELDRVGEQVPHHLLQALPVAHDRGRPFHDGDELDLLRLRRRPHRLDGGVDHPRHLDPADVQLHLAGDDPRHVEHVLDEAGLGLHVALDDLQPAHPRRLVDLLLAQDAGPPQDRGERRAQLVGERGQELVLGPVGDLRLRAGAFGLAVEQRVVHGQGLRLLARPHLAPGDHEQQQRRRRARRRAPPARSARRRRAGSGGRCGTGGSRRAPPCRTWCAS